MEERTRAVELNSCHLKWIAAVTMLIDHIGAIFYPELQGFRIIGRISFPVFAFLIAEGFHYTHDIRKYMSRMLFFACVSEIPFDLALFGTWFEPRHQNVMFTFFLALALLKCASKLQSAAQRDASNTYNGILEFAALIGAMAVSCVLQTDYSFFGILLVYAYWKYSVYKNRWKRLFPALLNLFAGGVQMWGILAAVPLYLYGGKEGRKMKFFFYLFYPGHLLLLYLIVRYL